MPKPYQKPLPEIRIAASTPDTFPAIGALGYPVFASTAAPDLADLAPHIKAYRDAYKAAGHPGKGQVFVRGADLSRRDRGAGARRGRGKRHAFLPAAIRS